MVLSEKNFRTLLSLLIEEEIKKKRPSMEVPPSPREKTKKYLNLRRSKDEESKLRDEIQKKIDEMDFDTKYIQPFIKKKSAEALTDLGLPSSKSTGTSHGDAIVSVEALVRYLINLYFKNEKYYGALNSTQWGAPTNAQIYDKDNLEKDEDDISGVNVF